jgi:hypothetical protein
MKNKPDDLREAGAWVGRYQAFAVVHGRCNLARAHCLLAMRDARAHQQYALTWDAFCKRFFDLSRSQADQIIGQLKEFGDTYFRLSELARITPETYRQLAPRIEGDILEIGGEKVALIPENAPKIRAAIRSFREEIHALHLETAQQRISMYDLNTRLDTLVGEFTRRSEHPLYKDDRETIANLLNHTIYRLTLLAKEFAPQKS